MSSYDFNKREDYDYSFSYAYLGGVGLGKSEVESERMRKSRLGTYDLTPVDPPNSDDERKQVMKIANMIHASPQREELVKKIFETRDKRLDFVWNNKHSLNQYFEWALHCIDREVVGWENIRRKRVTSLSTPLHTSSVGAATAPQLEVGNTVQIHSIKSRPELNGKVGIVVSKTNDRVMVEFTDINQTVSIGKANCVVAKEGTTDSSWKADLPRGLRVVVRGLTSDQGKLLNGLIGFIVDFKSERYLVRLDGSAIEDLKSVKADNLHVPPPDGWDEKIDESTGKPYYINRKDGSVSWDHPILSRARQKKNSKEKSEEFVKLDGQEDVSENETPAEETESGFNRDDFLREEAKRLKLDRRGKSTASKPTDVTESLATKLGDLRATLNIPSTQPIFSGTPRDLLTKIHDSEGRAKIKFFFAGLCVIFEDFKKLKFNKNQLVGLGDKIDDVIENDGKFPDGVVGWIESGLKIAIPTSYSV